MQDLMDKAQINKVQLKSYLIRRVAFELDRLSEPCYLPKLKKDYYELLNLCKLTESEVKKSMDDFYKGTKFSSFKIVKRPENHLVTFIIHYFLANNDLVGFSMSMKYFAIRHYTNLINKQFPRFCSPEAFRYALEHIPKIHLFSREGSIANAVVFISNEMERRYISALRDGEPDGVGAFIQECRTRISQSIKSFAEIYYDGLAKGAAYKSYEERVEDEEGEKFQTVTLQKEIQLADEFSRKICVYKLVDYNASVEAQKLSKVSPSIASVIISELTDVRYVDSLRMITTVYIKKILENKINICKDEYYDHIRALISLKRTNERIYFKQQIAILLDEILVNRKISNFTGQQQRFALNLFLAYYLTLIFRKQLCS